MKTPATDVVFFVSISLNLPDFHPCTPDDNQTLHEEHLDVLNPYGVSIKI